MADGGDTYGQLNPVPPAEAFHDASTPPRNWGHDTARRHEEGGDHPTVVALTSQAASTPERHGVPFGKRVHAAGPPAPQGSSGVLNDSAGVSEAAAQAALAGWPGVDVPRQERPAFLKHWICFVFVFQGACPRKEGSFNHDPTLMPTGYWKAHATKKRSAREGSREASRPRRMSYALSTEQADVVAALLRRGHRGGRKARKCTDVKPEGAPRGWIHLRRTRCGCLNTGSSRP